MHAAENEDVGVVLSATPESFDAPTASVTSTDYAAIFDIGAAADIVNNKLNMSDFEKYYFLKRTWCPPENYKLPYSEHHKKNMCVKRFLNLKHINMFEWIAYSDLKKGLFCKYCVLFAKSNSRVSKNLRNFVQEPVVKFAKLLGTDGYLLVHNNNSYHIQAVLDGQNFLKTFENPDCDVRNQIDTFRAAQANENRERLKPIIRSIMYLGKQNISLRGHRDDGPLKKESEYNEGNFRELLRFRVESGDEVLKKHLETTSSRATYISKTTQNELIHCIGEEICNVIIENIKTSKYYSVIFDETTDQAHVSQMSVVLRYIHQNEIKEDFISFIDCHEENYTPLDNDTLEPVLSGKVLGQTVLNIIKKVGLNLNNCVGICTDGCSVMVSKQHGAVKETKRV